MTSSHFYKTSADFIKGLDFNYVETYSFQRGIEWENYLKSARGEQQALNSRKAKRGITKEQEEKYELLTKLTNTQFLIDSNGNFHSSSEKIRTLKRNDSELERLITILEIEAKDAPAWMCGPVYRDAVVFYDNNDRIISTLNICFSCQHMSTKMFAEINADIKVYDLLRNLFLELGHKIEEG